MRQLTPSRHWKFVEKVRKTAIELAENFLRTKVSVNPTRLDSEFLNGFHVPSNKEELIALCILSWYLPPAEGILLQLDLEEELKHTESSLCRAMLTSEQRMLNFLILTQEWTEASFYEKILSERNIKAATNHVSKKMRSHLRPKEPIRRRGYKDKGTLKLLHEHHSDYDFRQEHYQMTLDKKSMEETYHRLLILLSCRSVGLPVHLNLFETFERRYKDYERKYKNRIRESSEENRKEWKSPRGTLREERQSRRSDKKPGEQTGESEKSTVADSGQVGTVRKLFPNAKVVLKRQEETNK
jgi:hypothetical protein